MLPHLLAIFVGFLGPLIMYLVIEKEKEFAKENSKNALNFVLSMILYNFALILLSILFFILIITIPLLFLTIPAIVGLSFFALIVQIIASVKAYNGEIFRYPLTIPFIH